MEKQRKIYLDHAAATPLDPSVLAAMMPFLTTQYENPSSLHAGGQLVRSAISAARASIASVLHATPSEIVFTSGGTESNNLALRGLLSAAKKRTEHPHIVISSIEHASIFALAKQLEREGVRITCLPVDQDGLVSATALRNALAKDTVCVSVMYANNEIGTIQPIKEIASVIRRFRTDNSTGYPYFHTDACQAAGALDLSCTSLGVDLLTLNGSKIYGPKGMGVLYIRRGTPIQPLLFGGDQEHGMRAGTEWVAGIVGIAAAFAIAEEKREQEALRLTNLRDRMISALQDAYPYKIKLNGHASLRLPNNVHLSFLGLDGERIVLECDAKGLEIASGSACKTAAAELSHVMQALTTDAAQRAGAVRITLGRTTTAPEVAEATKLLLLITERLFKESLHA